MSKFSPVLRVAGMSALAAGTVFALSGCGALMSAASGAGGSDDVMNLSVGDCFTEAEMNTAMSGGEVSEVPVVDCAESHDSEIFFSHQITGDAYPGDEAVGVEAEEVCYGDNFTNFIGVSYAESEIYAAYLTPTQESWDQADDREVLCYVTTSTTGETVTGTLEAANR